MSRRPKSSSSSPSSGRIRVRATRLDHVDSDKLTLAYWLLAKQTAQKEQAAEAAGLDPAELEQFAVPSSEEVQEPGQDEDFDVVSPASPPTASEERQVRRAEIYDELERMKARHQAELADLQDRLAVLNRQGLPKDVPPALVAPKLSATDRVPPEAVLDRGEGDALPKLQLQHRVRLRGGEGLASSGQYDLQFSPHPSSTPRPGLGG